MPLLETSGRCAAFRTPVLPTVPPSWGLRASYRPLASPPCAPSGPPLLQPSGAPPRRRNRLRAGARLAGRARRRGLYGESHRGWLQTRPRPRSEGPGTTACSPGGESSNVIAPCTELRGEPQRPTAGATWARAVTCDQVVHDEAVHVRALHVQVVELLHPLVFGDLIGLLCVAHPGSPLQDGSEGEGREPPTTETPPGGTRSDAAARTGVGRHLRPGGRPGDHKGGWRGERAGPQHPEAPGPGLGLSEGPG